MSTEPERDPWLLRAADADREQYVALLQSAFLEGRLSRDEYDERMDLAYRASTYADLAPLLSDLPIPPGDIPGPPVSLPVAAGPGGSAGSSAADHWRVVPRGVKVDSSPLVAIFGDVVRDGRWAVPSSLVSVASFGSVKLDLTHAMLESPVIEVKAVTVFGRIEITVPGDMRVEVTGSGLFGGFALRDHRSSAQRELPPPLRAPLIRVTGTALFSGVTVTVVADEPPPGSRSERVLPPPPVRKPIAARDPEQARDDDTR
ncbi:MAG: DUF1707 domain-containing protein [Candidatus Nanopelagicales bacterium]|nr:DUF1707 domain-containing protein [Candidatus Nanopelagicales bacterium]MDZ4249320.1 DUF1707 domain-containing protein [Candidatus Nanopelagicales bacterium]